MWSGVSQTWCSGRLTSATNTFRVWPTPSKYRSTLILQLLSAAAANGSQNAPVCQFKLLLIDGNQPNPISCLSAVTHLSIHSWFRPQAGLLVCCNCWETDRVDSVASIHILMSSRWKICFLALKGGLSEIQYSFISLTTALGSGNQKRLFCGEISKRGKFITEAFFFRKDKAEIKWLVQGHSESWWQRQRKNQGSGLRINGGKYPIKSGERTSPLNKINLIKSLISRLESCLGIGHCLSLLGSSKNKCWPLSVGLVAQSVPRAVMCIRLTYYRSGQNFHRWLPSGLNSGLGTTWTWSVTYTGSVK